MTFRIVLTALVFSLSSTAFAEPENTRAACSDHIDNDSDHHVDCEDQDCQDLLVCAQENAGAQLATRPPSPTEARRGRATTRVVAGAVMLPLGFLVAAASAGPYYFVPRTYGPTQKGYIAGGAVLDVAGVALMATGAVFVAQGAGELAATRRVSLAPTLDMGPNRVSLGLRGSF